MRVRCAVLLLAVEVVGGRVGGRGGREEATEMVKEEERERQRGARRGERKEGKRMGAHVCIECVCVFCPYAHQPDPLRRKEVDQTVWQVLHDSHFDSSHCSSSRHFGSRLF